MRIRPAGVVMRALARVRCSLGSFDVQTLHEQPKTGTPTDVPVPNRMSSRGPFDRAEDTLSLTNWVCKFYVIQTTKAVGRRLPSADQLQLFTFAPRKPPLNQPTGPIRERIHVPCCRGGRHLLDKHQQKGVSGVNCPRGEDSKFAGTLP